ncbi:hypothetical protein FRC03_011311 [Tulasnella sp. 419]|nr:hypothetical protein FRC03_011311 [Tulasnella sp. 419]
MQHKWIWKPRHCRHFCAVASGARPIRYAVKCPISTGHGVIVKPYSGTLRLNQAINLVSLSALFTRHMSVPMSNTPSSANNAFKRGPKTLVLCFDGTANEFDATNTNVIKVFSMLDKSDTSQQVVYYQTGIGTYGPPGTITSIGLQIAKILDLAFAWYLGAHVMGGYRFIMDNYESGDRICLFGFSRGAYTARALAGMIYRVGLLPRDNGEHVSFAWKLYENVERELQIQEAENVERWHSLNFRKTFSREVEIDFLGIWDTVNSVGLIGKGLPYTAKNPIVKHVAHAKALDETRAKFRNKHWAPNISNPNKPTDPPPQATDWADYAAIVKCQAEGAILKERPESSVEEVWFAGDHADVGGSHTTYKDECALSHIPLRWMVRQAIKHSTIKFDENVLRIYGIKLEYPRTGRLLDKVSTTLREDQQYPYFKRHDDSLESYMDRERLDALSKLHSEFEGRRGWLWNILEVMPTLKRTSKWWWPFKYSLGRPNLRTPRDPFCFVGSGKIKVHSSVRTRLQHDNGKFYTSETKLNVDDVRIEWVEDWEKDRFTPHSPPVGRLS